MRSIKRDLEEQRHDDEVSFAVADNRARQPAEVTRALEDYNAMASAASAASPSPRHG